MWNQRAITNEDEILSVTIGLKTSDWNEKANPLKLFETELVLVGDVPQRSNWIVI